MVLLADSGYYHHQPTNQPTRLSANEPAYVIVVIVVVVVVVVLLVLVAL